MKKVQPYQNIEEALNTLDNGGRFYNIFTKAGDGIISQAELGKVGGVFNNKQAAILFLELATSDLDEAAKGKLLSKMEPNLQSSHEKFMPQRLLPSEVKAKGVMSSSAIVTGVPKLTTSKTSFKGFIMVPISTGNITTFTMIPLIDMYDVYELRDEVSSESFIIAHSKSKEKLPEKKMKVAGIIKELKGNKQEDVGFKLFLEVLYHSEIA